MRTPANFFLLALHKEIEAGLALLLQSLGHGTLSSEHDEEYLKQSTITPYRLLTQGKQDSMNVENIHCTVLPAYNHVFHEASIFIICKTQTQDWSGIWNQEAYLDCFRMGSLYVSAVGIRTSVELPLSYLHQYVCITSGVLFWKLETCLLTMNTTGIWCRISPDEASMHCVLGPEDCPLVPLNSIPIL